MCVSGVGAFGGQERDKALKEAEESANLLNVRGRTLAVTSKGHPPRVFAFAADRAPLVSLAPRWAHRPCHTLVFHSLVHTADVTLQRQDGGVVSKEEFEAARLKMLRAALFKSMEKKPGGAEAGSSAPTAPAAPAAIAGLPASRLGAAPHLPAPVVPPLPVGVAVGGFPRPPLPPFGMPQMLPGVAAPRLPFPAVVPGVPRPGMLPVGLGAAGLPGVAMPPFLGNAAAMQGYLQQLAQRFPGADQGAATSAAAGAVAAEATPTSRSPSRSPGRGGGRSKSRSRSRSGSKHKRGSRSKGSRSRSRSESRSESRGSKSRSRSRSRRWVPRALQRVACTLCGCLLGLASIPRMASCPVECRVGPSFCLFVRACLCFVRACSFASAYVNLVACCIVDTLACFCLLCVLQW